MYQQREGGGKRAVRVTPWEPPPQAWPPREALLKVVGASIDREAEACGPQVVRPLPPCACTRPL